MNSPARSPFGRDEQIVLQILKDVGGASSLSNVLQLARERKLSEGETKSAIQILVAYKKVRISLARCLELTGEESVITQQQLAPPLTRTAGA